MSGVYATWEDALRAHQLPPSGLREILNGLSGLSGDVPIVLGGSISEGLANGSSDIDIYVIIPDERVDLDAAHTRTVKDLGGRPVVIKIVRFSAANALLDKLHEFNRGGCVDILLAESFTDDDRIVLDRLRTGLPIQGHEALAEIRAQIGDTLLRHKYLCALKMVKRRQVSAQALFEEADWQNLLFIARDIVDATADMLLAAAGDSSLSLKWRIKRLERQFGGIRSATGSAVEDGEQTRAFPGPSGASAAATYLDLSTFPAKPDLESSFRYASAAVAWSRSAALYGGSALAREATALKAVVCPRGFRAPALTLDAHLAFADGRFALRRLGKQDAGWEISGEAASILCMFDGSGERATSCDGAGDEVSMDLLQSLTEFLRERDFLIASSRPRSLL